MFRDFLAPVARALEPADMPAQSVTTNAIAPEAQMQALPGGYRTTQMLFVVAKLGLADLLASGPRTPSDLAAATQTEAQPLFRLLRALASIGVFAERADGHFELTPLATTLRSDVKSSMRPFALSYGEAWWWDGFRELLHSVRTGQTGFGCAHGVELFEYLDQHPEHARTFNANMSAMTQDEAQAVIEAYDFSGTKVLADVGGGLGTFACAVLHSQPSARAIVFDQPSVIAGGPAAVAPSGLLGRLEFVGGSFFEAVPAGADIYCLKDILHDWDDDQCVRILGSVRRAMTQTTRLLIIERVIPPGNEPFAGKMVDITMLVMTGGRERTAKEYRRLIDSAGLRLARMVPTSSGSSVIEAVIG